MISDGPSIYSSVEPPTEEPWRKPSYLLIRIISAGTRRRVNDRKTTLQDRNILTADSMDLMLMNITAFEEKHWNEVKEIYRQGLAGRNATFETEVPDYPEWIKKFHAHLLWVILDGDSVIGWAGLQPVSARKVYEGVAEVTIYVHADHGRKGVGKALMNHLVEQSEVAGIWTLHASIFPENTASIQLHQSAGFREIGYREKIAQLDGKWRDTVLLERRSKIVGV
jgi:L-amino acid N-acyltransferase YncA